MLETEIQHFSSLMQGTGVKMGRFSGIRLAIVLSVLCCAVHWSHGTDIVIDSYEITDPADPASDVTYNRATDTSLVFTVTVSSAATGGDVEGIDVYFAAADNSVIGTAKAAGGSAPTDLNPTPVTGGTSDVDLTGNTVELIFDSEEDCTAATQLCVQIKGDVDTTNDNDVHCLNLGTSPGEVGGKDCSDIATTAAPPDQTSATDGGTGTTDATTGESESGAGTAYLKWSVLTILVLATQTLIGN